MNGEKNVLEKFYENRNFLKQKTSDSIEKYRKGNAKITLIDSTSKPVSGAKIKVKQKTHHFRFGANIFMLDELETQEKNDLYKKHFSELFNMATLPFYWDALEPERGKPRYDKDSPKVYRRPSPDRCIEFCNRHGIEPREHALAYEAYFPKWLYESDVDEIKSELERRYSEISQRYADKIPTIEVTNELFWPRERRKTDFYLDPDYAVWCFKLAEKYFPKNQLCINESTELAWGDESNENDRYYKCIKENIEKGARIDAVGLQYHLFHKREESYEKTRQYLDPKELYNHLDLYSRFGKPLQITEVTVPAYSWEAKDENIQADIIENLYTLWFSHPNVEQIVYWNVVDGYAHLWVSDPEQIKASQGNMTIGENYYHGGLLRYDLSPKPAFFRLHELIHKKWHTEGEFITDEFGNIVFRGFYGEYEIEIVRDDKTYSKTINLHSESDNRINVVI